MAYTEERKEKVFRKIIDIIANEGRSVRDILKEKWAPSPSTFFQWLEDDEKKAKQYARACEIRADVLFDEMLSVAFTPEIGETLKVVQKGSNKEIEKTKGDMLGHRRLKVDTIKWAISRISPKKYGERLDLTSKGAKIDATPSLVRVEVIKPDFED